MRNIKQSQNNMLSFSTPFAIAKIHGNRNNPQLSGTALLYNSCKGGIIIQTKDNILIMPATLLLSLPDIQATK